MNFFIIFLITFFMAVSAGNISAETVSAETVPAEEMTVAEVHRVLQKGDVMWRADYPSADDGEGKKGVAGELPERSEGSERMTTPPMVKLPEKAVETKKTLSETEEAGKAGVLGEVKHPGVLESRPKNDEDELPELGTDVYSSVLPEKTGVSSVDGMKKSENAGNVGDVEETLPRNSGNISPAPGIPARSGEKIETFLPEAEKGVKPAVMGMDVPEARAITQVSGEEESRPAGNSGKTADSAPASGVSPKENASTEEKTGEKAPSRPWVALTFTIFLLLISAAGNVFLGWQFWDQRKMLEELVRK